MSFIKKNNSLQTALALFAMFFGAGNLIFPLALGKDALNHTPYVLIGFFITAILMPFLGVLAMVRFQGDIQGFFSKFGKKFGLLLAGLTISLLGPLGAAPRCLTIAYSACFKESSTLFLVLFSFLACLCIYLLASKEKGILKTLGTLFAPIKLGLLFLIIVKGFWDSPDTLLINSQDVPFTYFFDGIKNGYFTMDLMAALFFAPLVLSQLHLKEGGQTMKKASILAGLILALVYTGFSFLSYFHAESLKGIAKDQILPALSYKILGPYGSIFLMLAVSVACFSTALSLIAAFVNFMHVEIFQKRFSKKRILAFSCTLTFAITCFSFEGINQFLGPFLDYFYPILIVLTFYNFFAKQSPKGEVL